MVVGSSCSYHPVPVPPEAPGSGDCAKFIATRGRRWVKAIRLLCDWAAARRLVASETQYLARTSGRQGFALQQKRRSDDRADVPNPLGVRRALQRTTQAPHREGEPRARTGGHQTFEHRVDLPPLRPQWGFSGDGGPPPALRACAASVSTISMSCLPETRCSRAVPGPRARDMPWWYASARRGAAMNGKVCWSNRKP